MAKKAARSTADDATAPVERATKGARRGPKLNSGPDRPENISETLVAGETTSEPSDDEIRARAYEMYLERGGKHGLDFDDWVRAERELRQRR